MRSWATIRIVLCSTLVSTLASVGVCAAAETREITDMAGRKVVVPKTITRVCTDWPILGYLVYALDANLLAAVNAAFTDQQKELVPPSVRALPVVTGVFGAGRPGNIEALLTVKPDILLAEVSDDMSANRSSEERLQRFGIPVVYVKINATSDYPDAIVFLGSLLQREARSRTLAAYGRKVLENVRGIVRALPDGKRPRVFYAEGSSGLFTECDTSFHVELIALSGAINVHHCPKGLVRVKGKEPVNVEQVLLYDPDVVIAGEAAFYESVKKDSRWRDIKAVKAGRVYLVPRLLFDWFDRPPSFMRLLGIQWVMWRLYPDLYKVDMEMEARSFYRLFLGLEIPSDVMKNAIGKAARSY